MLQRLADLIDQLNEAIGRAIAWLTLGMVLVMCGSVLARYLLGAVWQPVQESITWMHATVFMLGLGYTLTHDEHVRVDLLSRHWSPRTRAAVELGCTLLLLAPFCALLLFGSLEYVASSWRIHESSRETGGLPAVYLLKTLIPLAAALLLLAGLSRALRAVLVLRGDLPELPHRHAAHVPDEVIDLPLRDTDPTHRAPPPRRRRR